MYIIEGSTAATCCLKTNTVLNISPFTISYERLITTHLTLSTVLGLQCLHQKFNLMTFHILSNPVLIDLCKFMVDIPINARGRPPIAVLSLEHLHILILRLSCCWANNAHQPIFPCKIRNFPTSLANDSVFKKSTPYQNFVPIGHNLHGHLFDDVILKPLTHVNIFYTC